jgi:hypothetical protein
MTHEEVKLAMKIAKRYLQQYWTGKDLDGLYIVELDSQEQYWQCYISCQTLDRHGRHLKITYSGATGEAKIQYFKVDNSQTAMIFHK